MDKEKNYLDSIEEFDETTLPEVNINQAEIDRVRKKVFGIIEGLKNKNKKLGFNIKLEDALKIKNELGNNADKAIYGVESAGLMRAIMLKTIKEKEELTAEDIVDELLIDVPAPNHWRGAAICYQLYLTKNKVIIYSFDSQYKVFSSYNLNFNEVKAAGEAGEAKCMMNSDEQIIELVNNTTIFLYPDYGGKKKQLLHFMKSLRESGIKDVDRSGFPWQFFAMKCMWILVSIVIIYLISMCIQ